MKKNLLVKNFLPTPIKDDAFSGSSSLKKILSYIFKHYDFISANNRQYLALKGAPVCTAIDIASNLMALVIRKFSYENGLHIMKDTISEVIALLESKIMFDGSEKTVSTRSTYYRINDQAVVEIDIGDYQNRVILSNGLVSVQQHSDTPMLTRESMRPLPLPSDEGNIDLLEDYISLSEDHYLLLVCWITYVIAHPRQANLPLPILIVNGSQGSGKTFLLKHIIGRLIDPSETLVSMLPRSVLDLGVELSNQSLGCFDNVEDISTDMSNALCCVATGANLNARKLYTNDELASLNLKAAVILNGICVTPHKPDFCSRVVTLTTNKIEHSDRMSESDLLIKLEQDLPKIYRGLLDLAAFGLAHQRTFDVMHPTRMLDFSKWIATIEDKLDCDAGILQEVYANNVAQSISEATMQNPLVYGVYELFKEQDVDVWEIGPTELFNRLNEFVPHRMRLSDKWPVTPSNLGKALRNLEDRLADVDISFVVKNGTSRNYRFTWIEE